MSEAEWAWWAVRVFVGVSLLLQAVGGWLAFVAYLDEHLGRAGTEKARNALHGAAQTRIFMEGGSGRERWPLRLTHRYFGTATRPSSSDSNVPFRNGGCLTAAKGARFLSYGFVGAAFYVSLLFEFPLVRLVSM